MTYIFPMTMITLMIQSHHTTINKQKNEKKKALYTQKSRRVSEHDSLGYCNVQLSRFSLLVVWCWLLYARYIILFADKIYKYQLTHESHSLRIRMCYDKFCVQNLIKLNNFECEYRGYCECAKWTITE